MRDFEKVIPEADRDFDLHTLYGIEVDASAVIAACRSYPMMSERQMVILREAQAMKKGELNKLAPYVAEPAATTVLVICFKGTPTGIKELTAALRKGGAVTFESKKIRESNIDATITSMARELGVNIEAKSATMLRDFIGADAARLYNELSKLAMILGRGAMITPEAVERNVGVSKDFNNFELVTAIARRDMAKALRIIDYFEANPRSNPSPVTSATIFGFFANLLIAHWTPDKSPNSLMSAMGLKWRGQLDDYLYALRYYNAYRTIEIISEIRRFDTRSKGVGSRQPEYALLRELIFAIFNAEGRLPFS